MKPITFDCHAELSAPPSEISAQLLDLSRWPEFKGRGIIPGIRTAEFFKRTEEVLGSQIRVITNDGSQYVTEIVDWQPARRVSLAMKELPPAIATLANGFVETWNLQATGSATRLTRHFEIQPKSFLTKVALLAITAALKNAIDDHLRQLAESN